MPDVTSDSRPWLSVVVVSFSRPLDLLQRCLKAIERQNKTGEIETIVVRDWRPDEGEQAAALGRCFPRITFLAATDTTVPHMRRRGVAESHGEIVALIEDDCIVDRRKRQQFGD